jgi:hypothetical protein
MMRSKDKGSARYLSREVTAEQTENLDTESDEFSDASSGSGNTASAHAWAWLRRPQNASKVAGLIWFVMGLYMYTQRNWPQDGVRKPYTFIDAMYLQVQIITTVGYGDILPETDTCCFWSAMYVLCATMVISSIVAGLVDDQHKRQQFLTSQGGRRYSALGLQEGLTLHEMQTRLENQRLLKAFLHWLFWLLAGVVFWTHYPGEVLNHPPNYVKAFYFSVVTLTTVGFGDFTPQTQAGRAFCAIWMLLGVHSFTTFVSAFSSWLLVGANKEKPRLTLQQVMRHHGKKECDEACFLAYRLINAGYIREEVDMDMVSALVKKSALTFQSLDSDGGGTVDPSELLRLNEEEEDRLYELEQKKALVRSASGTF